MLTEVDDLSDIAEIAKSLISDLQKVDMAYLLLQRTTKFSSVLTKWNEKADADKTWDNFKKHARDAQLILRNTGQLTVQESMNQAEIVNLVSKGVRQALADHTVPENADSLQEQANSVQVLDPMQAQLNHAKHPSTSTVSNGSTREPTTDTSSTYCTYHVSSPSDAFLQSLSYGTDASTPRCSTHSATPEPASFPSAFLLLDTWSLQP